ncbi:MAG: hypothetical protein AAFX78_03590 [Cyanobacteria bacterium J06638_20]
MSAFAKWGIGGIVAFVVLIGLIMMANEMTSSGDETREAAEEIRETVEDLRELKEEKNE